MAYLYMVYDDLPMKKLRFSIAAFFCVAEGQIWRHTTSPSLCWSSHLHWAPTPPLPHGERRSAQAPPCFSGHLTGTRLPKTQSETWWSLQKIKHFMGFNIQVQALQLASELSWIWVVAEKKSPSLMHQSGDWACLKIGYTIASSYGHVHVKNHDSP